MCTGDIPLSHLFLYVVSFVFIKMLLIKSLNASFDIFRAVVFLVAAN